jgi:hypothetical protein
MAAQYPSQFATVGAAVAKYRRPAIAVTAASRACRCRSNLVDARRVDPKGAYLGAPPATRLWRKPLEAHFLPEMLRYGAWAERGATPSAVKSQVKRVLQNPFRLSACLPGAGAHHGAVGPTSPGQAQSRTNVAVMAGRWSGRRHR